MLTLYGPLSSGNVYKVRLLLSQVGQPHRRVDVAQTRGEPMSEAFRSINPIGKVPAIRLDDGRLLSESGAILYHFAQGSALWPEDAWQQTQALRWMFFEQYCHEPAIAVNRYLLHFADGAGDHRGRIADNKVKGQVVLEAMERHLAEYDWFAPVGYSIADIALYAYTHIADEGGFDLAPYRSIGAWLGRVAEQPGHITLSQETSTERPISFAQYLAQARVSRKDTPR